MADSIGERVRAAREKKDISRWITVQRMAEEGCVAPVSWLRDLETGKATQMVHVARIVALAKVLGLQVDGLLAGDGKRRKR